MLLSIFCFLLAASRFILQTNMPEDLHLQRWSLSCYFHDEINCSNNWFVNETLLITKKKPKKKNVSRLKWLLRRFLAWAAFPRVCDCEMKPLKSICAKVNFCSLSSRSWVLLGVNTWKMPSSTNTGLAQSSCVQLNIIISTQDVSENERPRSMRGISMSLSR